jgi:hypothetical protein
MAHCHLIKDLIKQYGADPSMCGVSKSQVALWKLYIPFLTELSKESGIDEDTLSDNVSPTSVKRVLSLKKNSTQRQNSIKHIIDTIRSNHAPTKRSIEDAAGFNTKLPTVVNPVVLRKSVTTPTVLINNPDGNSNDKTRIFKSILTSGQIAEWVAFSERNGCDNEYEALCKITTLLHQL